MFEGDGLMADKEMLLDKINKFLNNATTDEVNVLDHLMDGMTLKQKEQTRSYINGVMQYKDEYKDDGSYEAEITLNPFLMNPLNIIHGGFTATFADTAMGTLVFYNLNDDQASVTSEIKINYIKPGIGSKLKCRAKIVHKGSHLCVVQAEILREDGDIVAISTGSFFIIKRPEHLDSIK